MVLPSGSLERLGVEGPNPGKPAEEDCKVPGCNWTGGWMPFLFPSPSEEPENGVVVSPPLATWLSSAPSEEKSRPPPVCGNGDGLMSAFNWD